MQYQQIVEGRFAERPNRFIARVRIGERTETVHVKNTGRCRELLVKDALVYLEKCPGPGRSTAYDLVAVKKGERIINMDSQAPNKAVEEWLRSGGLFDGVKQVRPETKYGNSRFDFYVETETEKIFLEVKGVTLEEDGVVRFPDAPSQRAVKHMEELVAAKRQGYRALVIFVVQMEKVAYFAPNRDTHPEFAQALCRAADEGVEVLAYDCAVTPDSMRINRPVPVALWERAREPADAGPCGKNSEDVKKTLRFPELSAIPRPLFLWYDKNRRILPWREDPAPYRVWISEIMLQQTRVEAVKPYFERFLQAYPDIEALADADPEELLKLWEGLGYYNRARNLKQAAEQIRTCFGGRMPDEYGELLKLKGIGSYTAGAIASIAYGRAVPAVDGNVLRVLSRLRADERPVTDPAVKASVEKELAETMPKDRPGDFNQAMMELGACVCIPNGAPLCGECPLGEMCLAHRLHKESAYPVKAGKKPRRIEEKTVLVVRDENRIAIRKRPDKGLLAGMYELPWLEGFQTAQRAARYLEDNGIGVLRIRPLPDAVHIFTHREWHMKGYLIRADELDRRPPGEEIGDWIYIEPRQTARQYPIPSAFDAYAEFLRAGTGKRKHREEGKK